MSQNEKIFVNNVSVNLDTIEYKFLSDPEGIPNLSVSAEDAATIMECDFNHIVIRLVRTVRFHPVDFFVLSVGVKITYYLNERTNSGFSSKKDLLKYAKEHLTILVNKTPICSSVSAIISQITSSFGQVPIITSATVIVKDE